MTTHLEKTQLLRSLYNPGDPLIVTNVWDAVTARIVAEAPGVKALATASHSISFAHGVPDGEGLSVQQAIDAAKVIIDAVDLPVSVDFERGYSPTADGVQANVERLLSVGAAGINIEDSTGNADSPLLDREVAASRVAAAFAAGNNVGIPLVINARTDALVRGGAWDEMVARANLYLGAGAEAIFVLGLKTEDDVRRAVNEIEGKVSVIAGAGYIPLAKLAELGVSRVSFGPRILGLTLAHLQAAATQLTAQGEYPAELGFDY